MALVRVYTYMRCAQIIVALQLFDTENPCGVAGPCQSIYIIIYILQSSSLDLLVLYEWGKGTQSNA